MSRRESRESPHSKPRDFLPSSRELGLVLLVALALRLALWWLLPREQLISDEAEYLAAATWLAQGRGFSFYVDWPWLHPPLYLGFLAPWLRLFGLSLGPIRLAQVFLSLLVPALVYLLARTAFGRRAGLVAGILTAIWLPLAMLPHLILAENLFLPLVLAALLCLTRWQQISSRKWLVAGGVLLGLATLTRGMTLAFLPLAALWVMGQARLQSARTEPPKTSRLRVALLNGALLIGAALLVILPWSGYNFLRYDQLILVDTTGGFNFWLGTQGGQLEHLRTVKLTLLDLPDPAARQAYAYRQGWEALKAEPEQFVAGRLNELLQLLRINYGAEERLADGFTLGTVPAHHLLALFFLEDTLYVLLVPLFLYGLFLSKGEAGRGLILLWLGYNLVLATAFFAISRFRLAMLPFVAIYATVFVHRPGHRLELKPFRLVAAGLLTTVFWIIVLPTYLGTYPASAGATILGLRGRRANTHLVRAEEAIAANHLDQANEELQIAMEYRPDGLYPMPPVQVGLAAWERARGNVQQALGTLDELEWYQAYLLKGDILRAQGDLDGARAQFGAWEVSERNPTKWAWTHLLPPSSRHIDLGGGLDMGLVDGVYLGETEGEVSYRWSGPEVRLRFPGAGTGQPATLHLHLRGWRPTGEAPAEVVVLLDNAEVARFEASAEWSEVRVPLPAVPEGEAVVLTLRSTVFLAGPRDMIETEELRLLGIMIDWAELR